MARVLRPGGRFAFSITHPTRWMFPDDPGEAGLTATQSYWDRTPYVEVDDATGVVAYVEHHRTLGDWVALLAGAGFADHRPASSPSGPRTTTGSGAAGQRTRGLLTPGTAIFAARLLPATDAPPPAFARNAAVPVTGANPGDRHRVRVVRSGRPSCAGVRVLGRVLGVVAGAGAATRQDDQRDAQQDQQDARR